jgi:hypothetical protein
VTGSDLAWGRPADAIVDALKKTWDIPLSKGGRVLALTIPEVKFKDGSLTTRRNDANKAIKAHKRDNL